MEDYKAVFSRLGFDANGAIKVILCAWQKLDERNFLKFLYRY
jgi:hypothetical protein